MVVLLLIATVTIFLTVEWILARRRASVVIKPTKTRSNGLSASFEHLFDRYFHPGHSWARFLSLKSAVVGIDDFTQKIMGIIDRVDLPPIGLEIEQGQQLWKVWHKNRVLSQPSPVGGKVVAVNESLVKNPSLANQSPYEEGWIAKVRSSDGRREVHNLLHASVAVHWLESVKSQVVQRLAPSLGPMFQDGGELIDDIGDRLSDQEWKEIVREFFQPD